MLNHLIKEAYQILEGKKISDELFFQLANLKENDILDLVSLAHKVTKKFAPNEYLCTIMNAKSGQCSENCSFCAQSAHHCTQIESYPLVKPENMLKNATIAYENGVRHFGIVTSGKSHLEINKDFTSILQGIHLIKKNMPDLMVCASLGILDRDTAFSLKKAGVVHYNINLQTNPDKYAQLVSTTHSVQDRIDTIKYLTEANIEVCSGGIIGLGEDMEDRVKLALTLRELDVNTIPLNVLIPIPGTKQENQNPVPVWQIAQTFSIFRLINPHRIIKFAAGRETVMKDFQALILLSGANGFLTGGYLTTRGRSFSDDNFLVQEINKF